MAKRRRRRQGQMARASMATKVQFLGHEILLTFIGSLIIALGAMLIVTGLEPTALSWLLSAVIIWLGLLIFLYPIVRKIEDLM